MTASTVALSRRRQIEGEIVAQNAISARNQNRKMQHMPRLGFSGFRVGLALKRVFGVPLYTASREAVARRNVESKPLSATHSMSPDKKAFVRMER
jgi:hypothetical protein